MFCAKCSTLAVIEGSIRSCVRCQGTITNNLSCICDNCSNEQKACSVCLKKAISLPNIQLKGCGCGSKK